MKTKNLLSVMAFIAMLLVPSGALAYSSGDIDGTTGTGTRDDPVLVDTYSELVAAMNSSEIEYVTVTGNIDHYLTTSEIKNNEALMTLPRGKVLELNADVHIFNYIVDPLLYSCIEVDSPSVYFKINGNGHILSCQFNSSGNPNAVVYMQHGTVVIDNAYIRAVSTYSYAYALWSKNDAITTIYSGRFYGECNFLKTVTDAWGVVIDGGKVTIEDGIFQAKSEDGSAWGIRFDPGVSAGNVKISGGKFAGMDSHYTSNNISEFIADGCSLVKTTDGTAVSAATKEIKYIVQVVDPAKILKKVALTVSEPVGGASPAKGTITSTGAYIHEETWYDDNGNKMSATDKFVKGKQYKYSVMAYPKEGYIITESTKGTINGNKANITNAGTGTYVNDDNTGWLTFDYTFTAKNEVKTIAVTVPEPVAGAEITSNIGTIASTSEGATLTGSWWADPNNTVYTSGGKFEEGKQYKYMPILTAKDGWLITGNTQCTVNGKAATFHAQLFDGYTYMLTVLNPPQESPAEHHPRGRR
jgi:hypothetical protein